MTNWAIFFVWLCWTVVLCSRRVQAAYYLSLSPAVYTNHPDAASPNAPTSKLGELERLDLIEDGNMRLAALPSVDSTEVRENSRIGAHLMAIRPDYIFRNAANVLGSYLDLKMDKQIRRNQADAYLTRKLRRSLLSSLRKK